MATADRKITLQKALPYILIVVGVIGIYCSFILTQDKFKLLENPNLHLSCSLNPIIACGDVIKSKQGSAFGFPNPYIGLAGFAGVLMVGITLIAATKLKRWYWLMLEAGLLFAVGFIHWLFYETVYRIHAICLYCIAVWIITITSFWYVTLYNIDQRNISLPKGRAQKIYPWVRRHHLDILITWLLIIAALILKHFWYYYGKHLHF
jgi:uncharacterized membrane protein